MEKDQLEKFQEHLLSEQKRLRDKISSLKDTDFGSSPGEDNEEADESEEIANSLATIEVLQERLDGIDAALGKIEAGTYGTCQVCGGAISLDLLEANPESPSCKECK